MYFSRRREIDDAREMPFRHWTKTRTKIRPTGDLRSLLSSPLKIFTQLGSSTEHPLGTCYKPVKCVTG